MQCRLGSTVEVATAAKALDDVEGIVVDEMTLTWDQQSIDSWQEEHVVW